MHFTSILNKKHRKPWAFTLGCIDVAISCLGIETVGVDSNPKKWNSKNLFRRNLYFPSFFNQYVRQLYMVAKVNIVV